MRTTAPTPGQSGGTMARGADAQSFDAFVLARLPQLLRFGRALTGSEHAAADLVQDALERTLARWSSVDQRDPDPYVRRAMVNRHISVWRRWGREQPTPDLADLGYADPVADPDLWEALRQLAPRQRAVLALRYFEDLTEAETARVLGCSVGTVKSQSHDAIARLRSMLEEGS
jgi:RNA polymerase sigma-70 factor (sigma-E family)